MGSRVGDMEVFLRVAEAGTFSAAGRMLDLTPSAVSKLMTRLEQRLGVSLFNRSNRGLALTQEGLTYHRHSVRLVSELDAVERSLVARGEAPRRRLRLAAPRAFGEHQLVPLLPHFLALHPELDVSLASGESTADVLDGHIDVAIRVGPVYDDSLHERKIASSRPHVVASPGYLRERGAPRTPADLAAHNCLRARSAADDWTFFVAGRACQGAASGNVESDSVETLRQLALAGHGLAWMPDYVIARDVGSGDLVTMLDAFTADQTQPISALFVGNHHLSSRVRSFLDFVAERFGRAAPFDFLTDGRETAARPRPAGALPVSAPR